METGILFHHQAAPDYWEHLVTSALDDGRITPEDANFIRKFVAYKQGSRGITFARATKIAQTLISWRQIFKTPWNEAAIDDLLEARAKLTSYTNGRGRSYKQNTIADHLRVLKSFYRWMVSRGHSRIKNEELAELKAPATDTETTKPHDLITAEELAKMIQACKTHRDRAILAITYETGARIGEIARLTWGDIQFDKYGARCVIHDEKTKKKRYPRLINSIAYLAAWRNGYYRGVAAAEGDNYVFIDTKGSPMEYRAITQVIQRAAKRAGITKRIHAHLFRKSRITELIKRNFQESVVKEVFWGNAATSMFKTYLRLSERDIDNEFLRKLGLVREEELNEELNKNKPKQCAYCFAVNPPESKFCRMCGRPLTTEAKAEVEKASATVQEMLKAVLMDPGRAKILLERLQELPDQAKFNNQISI